MNDGRAIRARRFPQEVSSKIREGGAGAFVVYRVAEVLFERGVELVARGAFVTGGSAPDSKRVRREESWSAWGATLEGKSVLCSSGDVLISERLGDQAKGRVSPF